MSITINGTLVGAEINPDDGRTVVKVHVDGGSGSGAQVVDGQIIVVFDGPAGLGDLAFGGDVVISVEAAPVEAQPAPEPVSVEAPVEPTPTEAPAEPLPTVLTPGGPAVAEAPAPEPVPAESTVPETPLEGPVEPPPVDPMAPIS